MGRVEFEDFGEQEVARIYLAARLAEAKHVEQTLSDNKIDYAVDIEAFRTYVLGFLPSEHNGVAFYVESGQAEFSRSLLHAAGLDAGLVEE